MKQRFSTLFAILVLTATTNYLSATSNHIVARVNNDAITKHELEQRLKFVAQINHLPESELDKPALKNTILNQLIDEHLYLQQGEKLKITVSDTEISTAISTIEQQNQLPNGFITEMFADRPALWQSYKQQLKAKLTWNKILRREIEPRLSLPAPNEGINAFYLPPQYIHYRYLTLESKTPINNKQLANLTCQTNTHEKGSITEHNLTLNEIPANLKALLLQANINQPLKSPAQPNQAVILCKRELTLENEAKMQYQEKLVMRKLNIAADDYLMKIKRQSYIEYTMK